MEFAVTVIGTAGPAASVDGTPVTVSQLSAAVAEIASSVPPPVFWMPTGTDCGPGVAVSAENATRLLVSVSCGDGALTVNDTSMVCVTPTQGLGAAQVMLTLA